MIVAGKNNKVFYKMDSLMTNTGDGTEMTNITNYNFNELAEILESAFFGRERKVRQAGFKDCNVSLSGELLAESNGYDGFFEFEVGDTVAIGTYTYSEDLSFGRQVLCIVEKIDISADASGKVTFSISFQSNGAVATLESPK